MSYPSPAIYDYRVSQIPSVTGRDPGYYVAQFSTDSGTTWRALSGLTYGSLNEALWAIASVVSDEVGFHERFVAGTSLVPGVPVITSYPPS